MKIGSKVLVKGSSNTYRGDIVGEGEENNRPTWIVLIQFPKLDIEIKPVVESSFFKDSLSHTYGNSGFYIKEKENE